MGASLPQHHVATLKSCAQLHLRPLHLPAPQFKKATHESNQNASSNQARLKPLRLGNYRLSLSLRELPPREPLRPDDQARLWRRMQDLHAPLYGLQMESRPNSAKQAYQHLPNMRPTEELLPMLHARSLLRSPNRRP